MLKLVCMVLIALGVILIVGGCTGWLRTVLHLTKGMKLHWQTDHYDHLTNIDDRPDEFGNQMAEPKNRYFKGTNVHGHGMKKLTRTENRSFVNTFMMGFIGAIPIMLAMTLLTRQSFGVFMGMFYTGIIGTMLPAFRHTDRKLTAEEEHRPVPEDTYTTRKAVLVFLLSAAAYWAAWRLLAMLG